MKLEFACEVNIGPRPTNDDRAMILNEILDTMRNMKVECHADQQKLYNHLKFNYPLQKAQ